MESVRKLFQAIHKWISFGNHAETCLQIEIVKAPPGFGTAPQLVQMRRAGECASGLLQGCFRAVSGSGVVHSDGPVS
jgi:hypothetical protein